MNWLRDLISHMMGWETYDEAYTRIWDEMESEHPRFDYAEHDYAEHDRKAAAAREAKAARLDNGGEYERGMKGFQ